MNLQRGRTERLLRRPATGLTITARNPAPEVELMEKEPDDAGRPALVSLGSGERIEVHAKALDANLVLTDRRLVVASEARLMIDVPIEQVRRIQFDIEKGRPATFVVVPEWPSDPSQSLAIPPDQYPQVARLLTAIGTRLHGLE
jgi:hypothetical protein